METRVSTPELEEIDTQLALLRLEAKRLRALRRVKAIEAAAARLRAEQPEVMDDQKVGADAD